MHIIKTLPVNSKMAEEAALILNMEMKYLERMFAQLNNSFAGPIIYQAWGSLYAGILEDYDNINKPDDTEHCSIRLQKIQVLYLKIDALYGDFTQKLAEVIQEWEDLGLTRKNLSIILSNLLEVKDLLEQLMQTEELPYYDSDTNKNVVERIHSLYEAFAVIMQIYIAEDRNDIFLLDIKEEIKLARNDVIEISQSGSFIHAALREFKKTLADQVDDLRLLKILAEAKCIMDYLNISQNLYDFLSPVRRVSFNPKYILALLNGVELATVECALMQPKRTPDVRREEMKAPSISKMPTLFCMESMDENIVSTFNNLTI